MIRTILRTLAGLATISVLAAAPAQAQTWDERISFTFTEPVAVPGAVLQPGDYVFRLADPNGNRKVMQVVSADMKNVHAMFTTNEVMRAEAPAEFEVTFAEAPAGTARPIDGLWAPGSVFGRGFIYGAQKGQGASGARRTAAAN